jgi:hypothetical protein
LQFVKRKMFVTNMSYQTITNTEYFTLSHFVGQWREVISSFHAFYVERSRARFLDAVFLTNIRDRKYLLYIFVSPIMFIIYVIFLI